MCVSVGLNIGLSSQHGLCQLFRPHPTSLNSYSSNKYNNSTAAIRTPSCWGNNQATNDDIYLWCLHFKYSTSTFNVSQKNYNEWPSSLITL